MGFAGTGSSFIGNRGEFSSAANRHRVKPVCERLVATVAVALLLSAFLAGCSGFFVGPTLTAVYVNPAGPTIAASNTVQLVAHGIYSDGHQSVITGNSLSWSSSAPTIATVTSPEGVVTGASTGTATITATVTATVPGSGCQVAVNLSSGTPTISKVCSSATTETLTANVNVSVTGE
jgi:Bacterial Ig-like domain (group 2)